MKKFIALLLTFLMVCSVAVVSFAEDAENTEPADSSEATENILDTEPVEEKEVATATDATSTDAPGESGNNNPAPVPVGFDRFGYDKDGNYNYQADSRLNYAPSNYPGIRMFGENLKGYYQMSSRKILAADPIPTVSYKKQVPVRDEETGEVLKDEKGNDVYEEVEAEVAFTDQTGVTPIAAEAIPLETYYATRCAACGKAIGGKSIYLLYSQKAGNCPICGEKIAPLDQLKFYRFICVKGDEDNTDDANSAHYSIFKYKDFTLALDSIYRDTKDSYGDKRDLPQKNLIWEKVTDPETGRSYHRLADFKTIYNGPSLNSWDEFGDDMLGRLKLFAYNLLFDIEYVYSLFAGIKIFDTFSNAQGNLIKPIFQAIDKVLTALTKIG